MASGRHTEGNKRGMTSILLVVALVIAVATLGWIVLRPDAGNADGCGDARKVIISVDTSMQKPMESAVAALGKDDCFPATVRTESAADVENSFFSGGRPDLWVADTPARVDRLSKLLISTTTLTPSLAMTPVGLVGREQAVEHDSWIEALEAEEVEYGDPGSDGAVALTLMAPVMERSTTNVNQDTLNKSIVVAAQNYGQKAAGAEEVVLDLSDLKDDSTKVIPVTEQTFVNADDDTLVDRTPKTGTPALTYPLVKANGGAPDTDVVAAELATWFKSTAGLDALAKAGLRAPTGEPLAEGGFGDHADLGAVPSDDFDVVLGRFNVLSVPSSLLAVFDASGSMNRQFGGRTRTDFAIEAALIALDAYPDQTRIGIWAFSTDQDGEGKDWIEMAAMKRLDDETEGVTHRKFLTQQAKTLRSRNRGATGLYDTTLAAYKTALEEFDRSYFNTVILLTDGANEDKGSISLKDLVKELEQLRDPNREIRVISIGITTDADMDALEQISQATGGQYFLAEKPDDIMDVFAGAMMARN